MFEGAKQIATIDSSDHFFFVPQAPRPVVRGPSPERRVCYRKSIFGPATLGLANGVRGLVLVTVDVEPAIRFAYESTDLVHAAWPAALRVSRDKLNHRMCLVNDIKAFDLQSQPTHRGRFQLARSGSSTGVPRVN
jgi:hypothetical protein